MSSLTPIEVTKLIERVRRATRNADVMAVCDALESLIQKPVAEIVNERQATFDRKAYQRDLMRKRRAEGKA
jgi:hypothetical protein